jgi:hypothetical protein
MYRKLIVSTCFTFQNNTFKDVWKLMSIGFLSINLMLNALTLWMLLYHFVCPGFTDFLIIGSLAKSSATYIYVFIYFLAPIVVINGFYILNSKRLNRIKARNSKYESIKLFRIHFILSFALAYTVLMCVI